MPNPMQPSQPMGMNQAPGQMASASNTAAAPGGTQTGQINEIMSALKQIIPQVVDGNGFVDVQRLVSMWPQFSQVPFQVVMQIIQQNPNLLTDIIVQNGLAGITINGRSISADELAGMGSGAMGGA